MTRLRVRVLACAGRAGYIVSSGSCNDSRKKLPARTLFRGWALFFQDEDLSKTESGPGSLSGEIQAWGNSSNVERSNVRTSRCHAIRN